MFTTLEQLDAAMEVPQLAPINKAAVSTTVAGQPISHWMTAGTPAAAAAPGTTPAYPNASTAGAIPGLSPVTRYTDKTYLSRAQLSCSGLQYVEFHDRLAHVGGLVGNITTTQTVDLDLLGNVSAARIGNPDYSEITWWLEVFVSPGTGNPLIYYSGVDNTGATFTTNLNFFSATVGAKGRLYPLELPVGYTDIAKVGIRSITSIRVDPVTSVAGNIGVVATRMLSSIWMPDSTPVVKNWSDLGVPEVTNSAVQMITRNSGTSSATIIGTVEAIQAP